MKWGRAAEGHYWHIVRIRDRAFCGVRIIPGSEVDRVPDEDLQPDPVPHKPINIPPDAPSIAPKRAETHKRCRNCDDALRYKGRAEALASNRTTRGDPSEYQSQFTFDDFDREG